jgi:PIN like domain
VTFFFDRSIGRRVPDALRLLGADVIKHDDLFGQRTPDDQWLVAAAQHGWTVVTKDKRIRFNEVERRAIQDARVGCFVLLSPKLTRWTMARLLLQVWDRLEAIAASEHRPFIYGVYADGSVKPLRLERTRPPRRSPR